MPFIFILCSLFLLVWMTCIFFLLLLLTGGTSYCIQLPFARFLLNYPSSAQDTIAVHDVDQVLQRHNVLLVQEVKFPTKTDKVCKERIEVTLLA